MSCTTAAAPRFRKLSAVDMMAANSPAKTMPASTGPAWNCRNCGAASSGLASSGWPPWMTRARIASPMPSHSSEQTA